MKVGQTWEYLVKWFKELVKWVWSDNLQTVIEDSDPKWAALSTGYWYVWAPQKESESKAVFP